MNLILTEGVLISMISWAFGVIVSLPISILLSHVVSTAIFSMPIEFTFTMKGVIIWLVTVLVLSVLASALPARNAARLTIREVLAYE